MNYEKKYKEAQKWIESIYSELSHEQQMEAEAFFPELKESEDERIRKGLIKALSSIGKRNWGGIDVFESISWLEKQGEHKLTDKIEPKFHEGEWITNGDYTWKIVEVKPLDYILQPQDGIIVDDTISHVDEQFHSFTIEDAKDGDVLASNRSIFIFSQEYIAGKPEAHCGIMNGLFLVKPEGCWTNEECYPATKEQRDTLMKAMADAGWEFDFEKKELKKIESTNKVEPFDKYEGLTDFERTLADICTGWIGEEIGWKEYIKDNANVLLKIAIKKFNSVQDASFEQKSAWSEEDEEILRTIISDGLRGAEFDMLQINWLKSLKQRIGWKPSDEQIQCLYDAIEHYQTNGYPASKLNELYEQMSKIYKL